MNENACQYVHSSKIVLACTLENVNVKRVMLAAASIATLTWHDLELNTISRAYVKPYSLFNFVIFYEYI